MNRETKFRAFVDGSMYTNHSVSLSIDGRISFLEGSGEWREIEPERANLMQYTGLKDKNGVEIYEGDVLAVYPTEFQEAYGTESRFAVSMEVGHWGLDTDWDHIKGSGYDCSTHIMRDHEDPPGCNYEVIGNIYQNPELLQPA